MLLTRYLEIEGYGNDAAIAPLIRRISERGSIRKGQLWRWLRAGQFYNVLRSRHVTLPPKPESPLGLVTLETLAVVDRFATTDEANRLFSEVLERRLSQSRLRQICNLYRSASASSTPQAAQMRVGVIGERQYQDQAITFESQAIGTLSQDACALQLLGAEHHLFMYEVVSLTRWRVGPSGIFAMLAIDTEHDATIHIFKPHFLFKSLNSSELDRLSIKAREMCDYYWLILPEKPDADLEKLAASVGIGLMLLLHGKLRVYRHPGRQPAGQLGRTILRMSIERLSGAATWTSLCPSPLNSRRKTRIG